MTESDSWTDNRDQADIEMEKRSLSEQERAQFRDRRGLEADDDESDEATREERRYGP